MSRNYDYFMQNWRVCLKAINWSSQRLCLLSTLSEVVCTNKAQGWYLLAALELFRCFTTMAAGCRNSESIDQWPVAEMSLGSSAEECDGCMLEWSVRLASKRCVWQTFHYNIPTLIFGRWTEEVLENEYSRAADHYYQHISQIIP